MLFKKEVVLVVEVNTQALKHQQVVGVVLDMELAWGHPIIVTVVAEVVVVGMAVVQLNQILPPIILTTQVVVLVLSTQPPMLHQDQVAIQDFNLIVGLQQMEITVLKVLVVLQKKVTGVMAMLE